MFCSACGAQVADNAAFCAACGKAMGQPSGGGDAAGPAPSAGGLTDNVAGALAYVTIIPAILFLVLEPYNRKPFVRFHAFQCLFLAGALIAIHIVLGFIPILGWMVSGLVSLATIVLLIVLIVKASQGQKLKLPVIGDMAEKQANAMP
jgi:uncharacterized membrane protein